MYIQTSLFLFISIVKATVILAQQAPPSHLSIRDVSQGWSLQSNSLVPSLQSCGNGAFCPISLHCNPSANHEVAACCSSSSDCRGQVENAPKCADLSWNLWVGYDGNGFCCEVGLVGAYDISKSVAGTCVSSGGVGALRSAVLTSTGSGAAATQAPSSGSIVTVTTSINDQKTLSLEKGTTVTAQKPSTLPTSSGATETVTASGTSSTLPTSSGGATEIVTANGTSSVTATPSATPTPNAGELVRSGLGLMGAALLAIAVL